MKIAFHFPGQGSQSLNMLSELATQFSIVQDIFQQASDVLHYDLWELTQKGPEEKLNETEVTQPAVLAADIAVWECWKVLDGPDPQVLAGHSLGEYAALVVAEAITFEAAIKVVALRGRAMQAAVPAGKGAMAAIVGLDDAEVIDLCDSASAGDIVSPANFNSIGQIVIAGEAAAVDRAIDLAKAKGAKIAKRIPVSIPSHCALMAPAVDQLAETLKTVAIQTPRIPIIHNVDVKTHHQENDIRDLLAKQLVSPVRWVETVVEMQKDHVELFVECGPGKVLAGLNKRILKTPLTESINTSDALRSVVESVKEKIQ